MGVLAQPSHPNGRRVVIVDDHPTMLRTASALLTPRFDVVATASRGDAGLEAVRRLVPDLVVLDISMPPPNGFQVARMLRGEGYRAPITFMSAHLGDDVVEVGLTLGGRGFVAKERLLQDLEAALVHVGQGRTFLPRATSLTLADDGQLGRHGLLLHETGAERVEAAVAYLSAAWRRGHALISVAPFEELQLIAAALSGRGIHLESAAEQGRYTAVDARVALEAIQRQGEVDGALFTALFGPLVGNLSSGFGAFRHVSAFGHIVPLLFARGRFDEGLALEAIATEFLRDRPLSVLCPCCAASPGSVDEILMVDRVCTAHHAITQSAS